MEFFDKLVSCFRAEYTLVHGAALAVFLPAIASGQEATISGVVTEAGSGTPIENAIVVASRGPTTFFTATTEASGAYHLTVPMNGLTELPIVLEAAGPEHAPARFGGEPEFPCYFWCGEGDGWITLEPGDVLVDHDIELEPGGRIAGTVTAGDTLEGLAGVEVAVYTSTGTQAREFSPLFAALTDADGNWELPLALPAGDFYLIAEPDAADNYVARAWDNLDCQKRVCPILGTNTVAVQAGSVTTGIDFTLRPGASISGTVLPDDTIRIVRVADGSGALFQSITLPPGQSEWSVNQLGGGSYYLEFGPQPGDAPLIRQLHNGLPCPYVGCDRASGPPLSVPQAGSLSGMDITLSEGGQLQGELLDAATGSPPDIDESLGGLTHMNIIAADGTVVGGGQISIIGEQVLIPTTAAVPPGEYYVRTFGDWWGRGVGHGLLPGYSDAAYPDVVCAGEGCDLEAAQTVSFDAGQTTSVTISINHGSSIGGTVVDDTTGEPISTANVKLVNADNQQLATTLTNADGDFFFGAFPAGSYYLRTSMSSRLGPGINARQLPYFDRMYGSSEDCSEQLCDPADASPLVLDGSSDIEGIEFRVTTGPVIRGRIFDQITGAPINRGQVELYDSTGALVGRYALDFFTGAFQTTALAPGTYTLEPLVSPAFIAAPGSASPASAPSTRRSADSMTVVIENDDVEANVSVVDQAIDRIFRSRFMDP